MRSRRIFFDVRPCEITQVKRPRAALASWALAMATLAALFSFGVREALACGPYVVGSVIRAGAPASGVEVDIRDSDNGICIPHHIITYTDPDGTFSVCPVCTGPVTITIGGQSRTEMVTSYTDFGVWDLGGVAGDSDQDSLTDARENALLQTYAPELRLHHADWAMPASVAWILPRTHMRYTHPDCSDHEIIPHGYVTNSNITEQSHQNTSGWPWCDHTGPYNRSDSYSPSDVKKGFFLQQYDSTHDGAHDDPRSWIAYGHVYPRNPGGAVVQYWLLYAYDDSLSGSNHEGDWEFVAVVVDANDQPVKLLYFGHGNIITYNPGDVTWVNGTHPVAYVAKGAHSNYAQASLGDCVGGPFYDNCDGGGVWWDTWDTTTFGGYVNVGEKGWPQNGSNWLRYSGRWGEIGATNLLAFTSGPKGPAYQWSSWHAWGSYEMCGTGSDEDIDGVIDEADCLPTPDLTITEVNPALAVNGYPGPTVVAPGGTFPVRCALQNLGGNVSQTFTTDLTLSIDAVGDPSDVPLDGPFEVNGIGPSSAIGPVPTWSAAVRSSTPPGSYYIHALADSTGVVNEGIYGEDNNEAVSSAKVRVVGNALVLDNFDDGVANGFTPHLGTWNAAPGSYVGIGTGTDQNDTVSLLSVPQTSVTMEFDFSVTAASGSYNPYLGAILRYQNSNRFLRVDTYRLSGTTTYVRLLGWNNGPITFAANAIPGNFLSGMHHVRIDDTGCRVTVWIDGAQVLSTAYSIAASTGSRGLFVNTGTTVSFENLVLETLDDDVDNDGYTACGGDCDDANPGANPGRTENCSTAFDDDCDGTINEGCTPGGGGSPLIKKIEVN